MSFFTKKRGKDLTILLVIIFTLLLGFSVGVTYASQVIKLIVDGKEIATDQPPFIKNGRTFVPVRFVAEALGYPVTWDEKKQSVIIGTPPEGIDLVNELKPYTNKGEKITNPVKVTGISYNKGFTFPSGLSDEIYWNLGGGFKTLTFNYGCLDDENYGADFSPIVVTADGKELERTDVYRNQGLREFSFDVTGVKILTFDGAASGALVNPRVK